MADRLTEARTIWEHRVVRLSVPVDSRTDRELDLYGKAGWELVAVGIQFNTHFAYFKRRALQSGGDE